MDLACPNKSSCQLCLTFKMFRCLKCSDGHVILHTTNGCVVLRALLRRPLGSGLLSANAGNWQLQPCLKPLCCIALNIGQVTRATSMTPDQELQCFAPFGTSKKHQIPRPTDPQVAREWVLFIQAAARLMNSSSHSDQQTAGMLAGVRGCRGCRAGPGGKGCSLM